MEPNSFRQVKLFDMEEEADVAEFNNLLRSKNVYDYEHHVGFSPMGGCKVLLFYRIKDPSTLERPRESTEDDDNT